MNRQNVLSNKSIARHSYDLKALRPLLSIIVLVMLIGFVVLSIDAHSHTYSSFDLELARATQRLDGNAWLDLLMRGVGEPGYPPQVYVWLVLAILIFWKSGLKWETAMLGFASVGIGVVGLIVKILVNRPRPDPNLIYVANPALDNGKYSYPAGHVESFMAILGFFLFLSFVLQHKYAWTRILEIIGFSIFLLFIGISRIYAGEHWPSDVLGAYLLGGLWLTLTIVLYEWGKSRFFTSRRMQKQKR